MITIESLVAVDAYFLFVAYKVARRQLMATTTGFHLILHRKITIGQLMVFISKRVEI